MKRMIVAIVLVIVGVAGISSFAQAARPSGGGLNICQHELQVNEQAPYAPGDEITFTIHTVTIQGRCGWSGSVEFLVTLVCVDGTQVTQPIEGAFALPEAITICDAFVRAVRYRGSFLVMDVWLDALNEPIVVG